MMVLVTYDVATGDTKGATRLRKVAKICQSYGQRVQYSVFECTVDSAMWVTIQAKLLRTINPEQDSLRVYYLGNNWERRIEHFGVRPAYEQGGTLIL